MAQVKIDGLNLWFKKNHVLRDITLEIQQNAVTAIMGPSGCGKSTLLRCLNRMNEIIEGCRTEGAVYIDGKNIYDEDTDVYDLRRRVGMVFQRPNPLPKSIFENVAFGPRIHKMADGKNMVKIVEESLKGAALYDEVKDRLHENAFSLSGGQQQRLCIARALAVKPEIILMDEPCSALDPIATAKIEDLMRHLAKKYTVIIVTHNVQQAARVSDNVAFLYLGKLVEYGKTSEVFENPQHELTERYITGEFG
ncbi:MAG: phosphate ABC transporter ATP-binding protein PstB [Thermoplasmata archaeon]|nr:phosphate ABC transporter ATP-binding protein PstB [Thermoplasmata archaeon]